jgi:hypothetical protein
MQNGKANCSIQTKNCVTINIILGSLYSISFQQFSQSGIFSSVWVGNNNTARHYIPGIQLRLLVTPQYFWGSNRSQLLPPSFLVAVASVYAHHTSVAMVTYTYLSLV